MTRERERELEGVKKIECLCVWKRVDAREREREGERERETNVRERVRKS